MKKPAFVIHICDTNALTRGGDGAMSKEQKNYCLDELIKSYQHIESEELITACYDQQLKVQGLYNKNNGDVINQAFWACVLHYERKQKRGLHNGV